MTATMRETSFRLQWKGLSKSDTTVLKAVGITLIVLHNFFHLLPGWMIENEFTFSSKNYHAFRDQFSLNLYNDIGLVLGYLGHYGVQLFVFLSAYGLYTSYQKKPLYYGKFIRERLWRLWPTFFLAALFFLAFTLITTSTLKHPDLFTGLLLRLTFVSNLVPGQSLSVVGPWWFYSMIFQFYLLFPLLRKGFIRYGLPFLVILSVVGLVSVHLFLYRFSSTGVFPVALVIGHLPTLSLGVALAKYKKGSMPLWILVVAVGLFFLSNMYEKAWLFSRICATTIFLYLYVFLKQVTSVGNNHLKKLLFFIGNLSMYLFAVNGFLRAPFLQLTEQQPSIAVKCLILFVFLLFVVLIALLLRATEKTVLRRLSKGGIPAQPVNGSDRSGTLIDRGEQQRTFLT